MKTIAFITRWSTPVYILVGMAFSAAVRAYDDPKIALAFLLLAASLAETFTREAAFHERARLPFFFWCYWASFILFVGGIVLAINK